MRYFILLLTTAFLLASCSTYQYVTLNAQNMTKNEHKELVWENDTMKVTYNFNGNCGPMNMSIYNKTDKPLYVSWKKSALIRNANSVSLFNANVQVAGVGSTVSAPSRRVSASSFIASFDLPDGSDFIPPGSFVNKGLLTVLNRNAVDADSVHNVKEEKVTGPTNVIATYRRLQFDEHESPVHFITYLTFALGNNATSEFTVQHSFYVTEVLLSKKQPAFFALYNYDGNKLYTVGK